MSQVHPLANFPFKVTLKDGTVRHTNLLSLTHGRIISLHVPGEYQRISLDDIAIIEIDDYSYQEEIKDEQPYIETVEVSKVRNYNPKYGENKVCKCGHIYYRHFDTYDEMEPVGCKYCPCFDFVPGPKQ